jgi:hypothetical protein
MDIFKICKLKKLNDDQKQRLIDDTMSINRTKETIFQNYFKHLSWDEDLVDKMLRNGHRIDCTDSHDQTLIHSVIHHCRGEKIATAKINWLLQNNTPIESSRYSFIDTIVDLAKGHHNKSVEWSERTILDIVCAYGESGKIKEFDTSIRDSKHACFNFCIWLNNVNCIEYLDTVFQCNYDVDDISLCNRDYLYKNRDTLARFLSKSSNAMSSMLVPAFHESFRADNSKTLPHIYLKVITEGIKNINLLYEFGFKDSDFEGVKYFWDHVWYLLKNPHGGHRDYKEILIYGLINGKIQDIPTCFVKIYKLELGDLKLFIKEGTVNDVDYGSTFGDVRVNPNVMKKHYVLFANQSHLSDIRVLAHHLFPEDVSDYPKVLERVIEITESNRYEEYTLERCEKNKKDIMDFLIECDGNYQSVTNDGKSKKKSKKKSNIVKVAKRLGTKRKMARISSKQTC